MVEKYVLITGANSGIGKAAALKFASEGYYVIMACRNLEISVPVQKEIMESSGSQQVDVLQLDLSSFESIRSFCEQYNAAYPRLDILIHNAAYLNHGIKEYQFSADDIELSFATNVFGPYLLTRLLEEELAKSEDPRILHACTTNIKNFFDPKRQIEFDNLQGEFRDTRPYSTYKMYGDSKMALLLLTFKLAELYGEKRITVNAIQINRVKLSKETIGKMQSYWKLLARLQNVTNPPTAHMADHYFHICTSEDFKGVTGRLINHKRELTVLAPSEKGLAQLGNIFGSKTYPCYAADPQNIEKVWRLCNILTAESLGND